MGRWGRSEGPHTKYMGLGSLKHFLFGISLHWWKNEVARATSKMAEYIEVLHGSVKEGGGVKCIKRGEIPYCTFTLTYCIVGPKMQKARQKDIPEHSHAPQTLKVSGS